jgi:hypothetical protein
VVEVGALLDRSSADEQDEVVVKESELDEAASF